MQHPKKYKIFESFGNCKFEKCPYLHVDNRTKNKGLKGLKGLKNDVRELKLELRQISTHAENSKNIETTEN